MFRFVVLFAFLIVTYGKDDCNLRNYGNGSPVCVCTKNDCDFIGPITPLTKGRYDMYTSSKDGARFRKTSGVYSNETNYLSKNSSYVIIHREKRYQKIFGFGGAFTDSAGINLLSLSNLTRDTVMRTYFSEDGIQYSMGRIPIAGTDFSTRPYTYDDVDGDFELKFFSLQTEDIDYKIPFIQQALKLTKGDLKFFGSAWTAPAWMKTNNRESGIGFLNISMYDAWANYYLKFIEAYDKSGIKIWGITTGNEPANGFIQQININDMAWVPLLHAQWIAQNLGPKIRTSKRYSDVKIMIVDDQRVYFPWIVRYILENKIAESYVDGSAVHYYTDKYVPAEVLSLTHYNYEDKFIFATEACEGSTAQEPVILGSWDRAENYLNSIIDDLNNWVCGWMDWNMALSTKGGPTWANNFVDSPIIVNKTADEFYKQPMFYALGHFSKFIRPGSVRIHSINNVVDVKSVAFENPDGGTVVQLFNPTDEKVNLTIHDKDSKLNFDVILEKRSISSVLYW